MQRYTRCMSAQSSNSRSIALLRIGVGLFFVIFGEYKVFGTEFTLHGGFQHYVSNMLHGECYPFMVPVLTFILAHLATAMAFAVAYGEFLIGLSLLIGAWSRLACVFGFALMVAMLFSGGYPGANVALWRYFGASLDWSVF